jgi:hypothetical protein
VISSTFFFLISKHLFFSNTHNENAYNHTIIWLKHCNVLRPKNLTPWRDSNQFEHLLFWRRARWPLCHASRDRCYDFKNIFADHNIGFWEKHHFFRRKLSKTAENCDHKLWFIISTPGRFCRHFDCRTFGCQHWKLCNYSVPTIAYILEKLYIRTNIFVCPAAVADIRVYVRVARFLLVHDTKTG